MIIREALDRLLEVFEEIEDGLVKDVLASATIDMRLSLGKITDACWQEEDQARKRFGKMGDGA
jgi:hypothetical protein